MKNLEECLAVAAVFPTKKTSVRNTSKIDDFKFSDTQQLVISLHSLVLRKLFHRTVLSVFRPCHSYLFGLRKDRNRVTMTIFSCRDEALITNP